MVSSRRPRGSATLADLLAMPEERRFHELLDGEIVPKAMPSGRHGNAQAGVSAALRRPFHRGPGGRWPGGWWILTEVEVQLDPDLCRPDVAGWRRERMPALPEHAPITIRPDWICEVLSPRNARADLVAKMRIYHSVGVPHYWIVDPTEELLTVYRWTPDGYLAALTAGREETVRAEPFDAVELRIGALLGDDEPES